MKIVIACMIILSVLSSRAAAQSSTPGPFEIAGAVSTAHNQQPIVGARVEIAELRRTTRTNTKGEFSFKEVPHGTYTLAVTADGYAGVTQTVDPSTGRLALTMDLSFHEEAVIVTASPGADEALKVYQPTSQLDAHELEQRAGAALGTTLQNEPGISTTNLGAAPSRPVIRGLQGDRVLVLDDGVRIGDVSSLSQDHAVAVDPSAAERIEIIRGPANLLYGSNAIGGVVNVISGDIPSKLLDRPSGSISFSASDNTSEVAGSADLSASAGPVAFRVGGSRSDADEFGYKRGTAGNSQYDFTTWKAGVSLVRPSGFIGASFRDYEGDYGIPVEEDGTPLGRGERGVTIGMSQESVKLTGQITRPFGPFLGARLQAVQRDYTHTEFEETGEPGTVFNQDTIESRFDMTHRAFEKLSGTFGVWYLNEEFEAVGDEALLPFAETTGVAGFFYEKLDLKRVKLLFGGRYDDQSVDPRTSPGERSFQGVSGAIGAVFNPEAKWSVAANVTRNYKVPADEELFANGPHIASLRFEVGDPDLDEETSVGVDLSFAWRTKRFSGEVTAFRSDFQDYIFLVDTGATDPDSGLLIANYTQTDALFQGLEAHADISLLEHLTLELVGDYVRATDEDAGEPLPRIPPHRLGLGLNWDTDRYGLGAEARYGGKQGRVSPAQIPEETPTGAYTIYNAFAHVQYTSGPVIHRIALRAENLGDRLYRNHVSLVKEAVPQPGRMAKLTYSVIF